MGVFMTVRIINNFWSIYKDNKAVITRCFHHHFNSNPDADGIDGSFNNLIVELHRLNIFEKFNLRKLAEAAGKTDLLNKETLTEEDLIRAGIDVQKKWEQFLFNWIKSILNHKYVANGKHSRRFIRSAEVADYGIPMEDRSPWIETEKEARSYEDKLATDSGDRRGRVIPPTFDNRYIAGEDEFDDQLEAQSAADLKDHIMSKLTGIKEQKVFTLMVQGFSEKEIAHELNYSQQYINILIRKIRNVTEKICA
jgi:hypothetical protein